ncbi:MAG: RNA-dependent RNA polymerase [Fushun totivirus 5]|nr:MAG: RNA-dependent RNA polymerase [Fushun totivirus 5]
MLHVAQIPCSQSLLEFPGDITNIFVRLWTSSDFNDSLLPNYSYESLQKLRRSKFTTSGYRPPHHKPFMRRLMSVLPFSGFDSNSKKDSESRWVNPFGNPFIYYADKLDSLNPDFTKFFIKMMTVMTPFYKSCHPSKRQDFVRKTFAKLSSLIFDNIYNLEHASTYTPIYGLETLGGPAGHTHEQINNMARQWVSETPRKWGANHKDFVVSRLNHYLGKWVKERPRTSPLTFEQFCTDPYKWATSGGTYPVVIPDSDTKVRNKWGFGIINLFNGTNPYESAVTHKSSDTAVVALKEESKTRLIISTPMSSYLRQSYLSYVLGPMSGLNSTLFDKNIVTRFFNSVTEYVALDASSFDQNIPKWFVSSFFEILLLHVSQLQGDLLPTQQLRGDLIDVLTAEIGSLNRLEVRYLDKTFPYRNGLLSGWRFTSLLGSLASAIVCDFINSEYGTACPYIVQGDDIIMAYDKFFGPKESILKTVSDFGMTVNTRKSTFGAVGEFLKYRYHPTLIDAIPARAVRSIFYMNPWLSNDPVDPIATCVNSHLNLISRLCMASRSSTFVSDAVNGMVLDLSGLLGFSVRRVRELLEVPLEAGGLGCFEMVNSHKYIDKFFNKGEMSGPLFMKTKSVSIPVLDIQLKSHFSTSPMTTFLSKFNISSFKQTNTYTTKDVKISKSTVNIDTFARFFSNPSLSVTYDTPDMLTSEEPKDIDYFSVNKYATLLAVLVQKTRDQRFSTALHTCKGEILDLCSSFVRLAEASFFGALKFFDKMEEIISPPKSLFFDTRYFPSPQARSLTDFVRKSLHSCLTLPSLVFLNLLSSSMYGSYHSFIHSL